MTVEKILYETLIRSGPTGSYQGAHHQFREVVKNDEGVVIAETLLPATPFGSDPDFPSSGLLSTLTEEALALAETKVAEAAAATAAKATAETALAAALAQVEALTAQVAELTAEPEKPPGKWWVNAAAFLEEFSSDELFAIHTSQVPLIVQLAMTLLAWTGEVWSSDQRITLGMQALVSTGVLTAERRNEILS